MDISALQELELRCDALEQRKQQLGCPGAENGEPMSQFPKSPEMVPNFHDISTWKRWPGQADQRQTWKRTER